MNKHIVICQIEDLLTSVFYKDKHIKRPKHDHSFRARVFITILKQQASTGDVHSAVWHTNFKGEALHSTPASQT